MNWDPFRMIRKAVDAALTDRAPASGALQLLIGSWEAGKPATWQFNPVEQVKHYKGWVYAAIRAIVGGTTSSPLHFYIEREEGEVEELPYSHPLRKLFRSVNSNMTFRDLMAQTTIDLELTGNAYWALSRNPQGQPVEIWTLPPQYVKVVAGGPGGRFVAGYEFKGNKGKKLYPPRNILHFKYANPSNLFYGYSPLQAAAEAVDTDEGIATTQYRMFKKGLFPGQLVLNIPRNLNKDTVTRLREELEAAFAGSDRAARAFIAHSGATLQPLTLKPREMDFRQSSITTRQRILGIFGVPEALAGIPEGTNKASAQVFEYIFARYTVQPKLDYISGVISEFLAPEFDESIFAEFDSTVPKDEEMLRNTLRSDVDGGIITPNEARTEIGYEPVEDQPEADMLRVPGSAVMASLVVPATPQQGILEEKQEGPAIPPGGASPNLLMEYIFDRDLESAAFDSATSGKIAESLAQGAALEAKRLGAEVDVSKPGYVSDLMERSRSRWDETVGETTVKDLKATLAQGIEAHETPVQLEARIHKLFDETYKGRATAIARTEVVSAANAGAVRVAKEMGITEKKWVATIDEHTRSTHLAADAADPVPIGGTFRVGEAQLRYPGDPLGPPGEIVNCRCTVTSVVGKSAEFYKEVDAAFRREQKRLEEAMAADIMEYFKGSKERVARRLRVFYERGLGELPIEQREPVKRLDPKATDLGVANRKRRKRFRVRRAFLRHRMP